MRSASETLHVVKVFVNSAGEGGNLLGVFLNADGWAAEVRQAIAADLNFSETVFVNDAASGALRIHTPTVELPLAGHPLVGTAWLFAEMGMNSEVLRPPAGEVPAWQTDGYTWIKAQPEWAPLTCVSCANPPMWTPTQVLGQMSTCRCGHG